MSDLKQFRQMLDQQKGRRTHIEDMIQKTKQDIRNKGRDVKRHEKAVEITQTVALLTQQQLQYHISDVVSMALESVFPNPYTLDVEFVQRRNKTECDITFNREGMKLEPLSGGGGGPVDVAGFALRIASWSMQQPRSRNTIFLDEPFKHLSTNLLPLAGGMLKEISNKLGLQIIMVTHSEELVDSADKVFKVGINKKISLIEEVK